MEATGWEPKGRVLDIGCGTGRLSMLCSEYVGCDVAPAMVAFAAARGLDARVIDGAADLPDGPFDTVACLSVFTHIARQDRQDYLAAIRERLTGEALVDILPGDEGGDIGRWTAHVGEFERDLADAGFAVLSVFEWRSRDSALHRYYRIR
jgi:SAM-dependent methyltransferase